MKEDKNVSAVLSSFYCDYDSDIEFFLKEKAINFERLSKSRTYLIFNEDEMESKSIEEMDVIGYFTLAQKVLSIPDTVSNRTRKEIDGLSAKIHGERIKDFPCYLIGQIGRSSKYSNNDVSGKRILQYANDQIAVAVSIIGGRYVMIECKDEEKLIKFYSDNEYVRISDEEIDGYRLIQMIRKI